TKVKDPGSLDFAPQPLVPSVENDLDACAPPRREVWLCELLVRRVENDNLRVIERAWLESRFAYLFMRVARVFQGDDCTAPFEVLTQRVGRAQRVDFDPGPKREAKQMHAFTAERLPDGSYSVQLARWLVVVDLARRLGDSLAHPQAPRRTRKEIRIDRCTVTADTDTRHQ